MWEQDTTLLQGVPSRLDSREQEARGRTLPAVDFAPFSNRNGLPAEQAALPEREQNPVRPCLVHELRSHSM